MNIFCQSIVTFIFIIVLLYNLFDVLGDYENIISYSLIGIVFSTIIYIMISTLPDFLKYSINTIGIIIKQLFTKKPKRVKRRVGETDVVADTVNAEIKKNQDGKTTTNNAQKLANIHSPF